MGSANLDTVTSIDHDLRSGETSFASSYLEAAGGKGLNQALAVQAARPAAFVACVGSDEAADVVLEYATERGLDVSEVARSARPTGRAIVLLFASGDNSIVVAPMANADLRARHVFDALVRLAPSIVLVQFEVPEDCVGVAADWAEDNEARLVVNPSPYRPMDTRLLAQSDPLIVNRIEAEQLLGESLSPEESCVELALRTRSVVVTDGANGAWVSEGHVATHVPVLTRVEAVDTSGAGDAFAGRLVAGLSQGKSLLQATSAAVVEASRVVGLARGER